MLKKGQVTIFIIIALVIVGAVLITFAVKEGALQNAFGKEKILSPEAARVQNYMQNCLEQTLEDGIYFIGLQGGYFYMPENFVDISFYSVPIHFYNGKSYFPKLNFIEDELGSYIEQRMALCINLTELEQEGFNITEDYGFDAKVSFENGKVSSKINHQITVRKGETAERLNEFESSLDFDFNYIYDILEEIKTEQEKNTNYFPVGAFTDLAYYYDFTYEVMYLPEDIVVYSIYFNNTKKFEEPYVFSLGGEYDW